MSQPPDPVVEPDVVRPRSEGAVARQTAASRKNRINYLWEGTQALLAISLTLAAIYVATVDGHPESETLKNALFVVLGFYFGRTNHSRPVPEPLTPEEE